MSAISDTATVILGAGITGLSTAYFLALAQLDGASNGLSKTSPPILVVDPSASFCSGAFGQNEGALGDFGYVDQVKPLALFSYALHQQLAAETNGSEQYGLTELDLHAVFTNNYSQPHLKLPFSLQEPEALSALPEWLKVDPSWQAALIAGAPHTLRLGPIRFCKLLYDQCETLGVQFLFKSRVVSVKANLYESRLESAEISTGETSDPIEVPCRSIVIAAGSWSDRLFSSLFPDARVRIPLVESQPSQSWLRVQSSKVKFSTGVYRCDQVWLNEVIANMTDFHLSTFREGDMYVAGDFSAPDDLPELPEDVETHHGDIETLLETAKNFLNTSDNQDVRVRSFGRAFLPKTVTGIPVIAKLEWADVFPSSVRAAVQRPLGNMNLPRDMGGRRGGIFVNVGQYLDGLVLGPGSGELMTELILGLPTSVDIAPFNMPRFGPAAL